MRSSFSEFYRPQSEEEQRFVVEGTIVVDANVLLDLYGFTAAQRDKVLGVLESVRDRIWIPHQVGLEYQRNRLRIIQRQSAQYRRLIDLHGAKTFERLTDELAKVDVPTEVADEVRPLLADLAVKLDSAVADYATTVADIVDRHVVAPRSGGHDDPVRDRLDVIFDGRVGGRPDEKTMTARLQEAEQRFAAEVPPGYKDADKEGQDRKAGDYLLWAELLAHAKATEDDNRPTLLVTNDVKEDWYEKSGGAVVGPRPELVREFGTHKVHGYHQVTLDVLLRLANEYLAADVDDETIEKASELAQFGESDQFGYTGADRANSAGQGGDEARRAAFHALREFANLSARESIGSSPEALRLIRTFAADQGGLGESGRQMAQAVLRAQGNRTIPMSDDATRRMVETILAAQAVGARSEVPLESVTRELIEALAAIEQRRAREADDPSDDDGGDAGVLAPV